MDLKVRISKQIALGRLDSLSKLRERVVWQNLTWHHITKLYILMGEIIFFSKNMCIL